MSKPRKTREEYLEMLRQRTADAWVEAARLFHRKKDSPALRLLLDLSEVAQAHGSADEFLGLVRALDESYVARRARRVGIPARDAAPPERSVRRPLVPAGGGRKKTPGWAEVERICRLDRAQVSKAKELGLKPSALYHRHTHGGKRRRSDVSAWIDEQYLEQFGEALDLPLHGPEPLAVEAEAPVDPLWEEFDLPF